MIRWWHTPLALGTPLGEKFYLKRIAEELVPAYPEHDGVPAGQPYQFPPSPAKNCLGVEGPLAKGSLGAF